ncbi:hypothetical protein ACTXT7_008073 [Hymenolepis weldensis]
MLWPSEGPRRSPCLIFDNLLCETHRFRVQRQRPRCLTEWEIWVWMYKSTVGYDSDTEKEVVQWINELTGESVPLGRENFAAALKNGQILVKLINKVYEGTDPPPPTVKKKKHPFRANTMSAPFKQMENIQIFLTACEAYGVPRASLFQTVDLYEMRNMAQVLSCLLQLGTEVRIRLYL